MPAVSLSPILTAAMQFQNDGTPLSGGLLHTYISGTTVPAVTYSDPTGDTPNTNPIELDSSGRLPVPLYLKNSTNYTLTLTTPGGDVVTSTDNVFFGGGGVIPGVYALLNGDSEEDFQAKTLFADTVFATDVLGFANNTGHFAEQIGDKTSDMNLEFVTGASTGQMRTSNSFLAPGASATFKFNNSYVTYYDTLLLNIAQDATLGAYTLQVDRIDAGEVWITITNRSDTALGEAIIINFARLQGGFYS